MADRAVHLGSKVRSIMADFETDYLIIGAGAVGLAFADTLMDEDPDCHIAIVDRHAKPDGQRYPRGRLNALFALRQKMRYIMTDYETA